MTFHILVLRIHIDDSISRVYVVASQAYKELLPHLQAQHVTAADVIAEVDDEEGFLDMLWGAWCVCVSSNLSSNVAILALVGRVRLSDIVALSYHRNPCMFVIILWVRIQWHDWDRVWRNTRATFAARNRLCTTHTISIYTYLSIYRYIDIYIYMYRLLCRSYIRSFDRMHLESHRVPRCTRVIVLFVEDCVDVIYIYIYIYINQPHTHQHTKT